MPVDERVEVRIDVISDPRQLSKFRDELMRFDKGMTELNKRIREYNANADAAGKKKLSIADTAAIRRAERSMRRVNSTVQEGIVVQDKLNKARRDADRMLNIYNKTNKKFGWSQRQVIDNMRLTREALIKGSRTYRKANDDLQRLRDQTMRTRTAEDKLREAHKVLSAAYKAGVFGVERGIRTWMRYRKELKQVNAAIRRNEREMRRSKRSFERWTHTINAFKYGTIALAIREIGQAFSFVAGKADEVRLMRNRLTELSGSSDTFMAIVDAANNAGAALDVAVASSSRLAVATREMNIPVKDFAQLNENIFKLGILGGATSTDLRMATIQLAQGLASATFQGDELRTVLESMPILMDQLAQSMGVARGQMKQLGREGALTPERVVPALLDITDKVNDMFAQLPFTFQQTMNVLKNSTAIFIEEFDKFTGFGKGVKKMMFGLVNLMAEARDFMATSPAVSSVGGAMADSWMMSIREGLFDEAFWSDLSRNFNMFFEQMGMGTGAGGFVMEDLKKAILNLPSTMRLGFTTLFAGAHNIFDRVITSAKNAFDRFIHDLSTVMLRMTIAILKGVDKILPGDILSADIAGAEERLDQMEARRDASIAKREEEFQKRVDARLAAVLAANDDLDMADARRRAMQEQREADRLEALRLEQEFLAKRSQEKDKEDADVLVAGFRQEVQNQQKLAAAYLQGSEAVREVNIQLAIQDRILKLRLKGNQESAIAQVDEWVRKQFDAKDATEENRKALQDYISMIKELDDALSGNILDSFQRQIDLLNKNMEGDSDSVQGNRRTALFQKQLEEFIDFLGLETSLFKDELAMRHEILKEALDRDFITKAQHAELSAELNRKTAEEQLESLDTMRAGATLGFQELLDQGNKANQAFGKSLVGTIGTAQEEIANGFTDVAMGAKSASEATKEMGRAIVSDLLRALARWAAQQATMFALQAAGIATTTTVAGTAAAGLTAAWAPAATLASIATLGSAAAVGSGAVAAALAGSVVSGAAASAATGLGTVSGANAGGMLHGGISTVPREGTFLLDKGERVVSAEQNQDLTRFLGEAQGGAMSGDVTIVNNGAPVEVVSNTIDENGRREIVLEAVEAARDDFVEGIQSGYGPQADALRDSYRLRRDV